MNTNIDHEGPWRTKAQMAERYQCTVRTITNLMNRGVLPFIKVGRLVRFNVVECDKALGKYRGGNDLLLL